MICGSTKYRKTSFSLFFICKILVSRSQKIKIHSSWYFCFEPIKNTKDRCMKLCNYHPKFARTSRVFRCTHLVARSCSLWFMTNKQFLNHYSGFHGGKKLGSSKLFMSRCDNSCIQKTRKVWLLTNNADKCWHLQVREADSSKQHFTAYICLKMSILSATFTIWKTILNFISEHTYFLFELSLSLSHLFL